MVEPTKDVFSHLLAMLLGCFAAVYVLGLGIGACYQSYNYDEVQRAHSVWLTTQQMRPYDDFFECHPPYFVLLSPIAWVADEDPRRYLTLLRLFSLAGSIVYLLCFVDIGRQLTGDGRWTAVCLLCFASTEVVQKLLVEFRIDSWAYALIFAAIALRMHGTLQGRRGMFVFGTVTSLASGLLCPKLVLLPLLYACFDIGMTGGLSRKDRFSLMAGFLGGCATAAGLFFLFLFTQGISVSRTIDFVVKYNAIHNRLSYFGFGLAEEIYTHKIELACILLSLGWLLFIRETRPLLRMPFPLACLCWLIIQASITSYPYKQYIGPWLLVACIFPMLLGAVKSTTPWKLILSLAVFGISLFQIASVRWPQMRERPAVAHARTLKLMNDLAEPDLPVVATPPLHPIFRRDSTFVWFTTVDNKGFDSDHVLSQIPSASTLVTTESYLQQLEANPPAYMLTDSRDFLIYPHQLEAAIDSFARQRDYKSIPLGAIELAIPPDSTIPNDLTPLQPASQ